MYSSNNYHTFQVASAIIGGGDGGGDGGGKRGGRYHYQKGRKNNYNYPPKKYNENKKIHDPIIIPELVDSKKIFVHSLGVKIKDYSLRNFMSMYGTVVDMNIIRKQGKGKSFAFITFESEEATEKILKLTKEECKIDGYRFGVKPGKLQFKVPGMTGFQRTQISDREFNLEPEDPTQVSIHMLIDDVLLRIMDFLSLRDLLRIDGVCRRWQSLVHTSFRSKIPEIMESNINMWLSQNIINPILPVISKVLNFCGESLLSLSVSDRDLFKGKLFKVVEQLCPSLETLNIDSLCQRSIPFLKEFSVCCPCLKSFKCTQSVHLLDKDLTFILVNFQNLETLHIEGSMLLGEFLSKLPDTLQVLELPRCKDILFTYLSEIYTRCPLLKVLRMDDSVECPHGFVNELSTKCQYLSELSITCHEHLPDFTSMKNLKKLSFRGISYSLNSLLVSLPPELETLKLHGRMQETENDLVDFSVLKNLQVLSLPMQSFNSLSIQSIRTISYCPKLVNFRYHGTNNHKPAILDIIRRCQDLKDLECMGVTLSDEDLDSFVEANKRRVGVLRMTIGLNKSGMDVVEKLSEAKYDVNMFDVDNIFGEGRLYSDDYEDDDYDFYQGFMSDEDYDSDNPFDFDAFDDDDFLYYENYGFVQPWEMIFGNLGSPDDADSFDIEDYY